MSAKRAAWPPDVPPPAGLRPATGSPPRGPPAGPLPGDRPLPRVLPPAEPLPGAIPPPEGWPDRLLPRKGAAGRAKGFGIEPVPLRPTAFVRERRVPGAGGMEDAAIGVPAAEQVASPAARPA